LLAKDECHGIATALLKLGRVVSDAAVRSDMVHYSPEHVSQAERQKFLLIALLLLRDSRSPLRSAAGPDLRGGERPEHQASLVPTNKWPFT